MLLENGKLVLDGRDIATHIARIAVLRDQPERNFSPRPSVSRYSVAVRLWAG